MKKSAFDKALVKKVSQCLQDFMHSHQIDQLTADEGSQILSENNILSNRVGPKPGFNFRQLLRDGRDGKIENIDGVYQKRPHTKWIIYRK